MPTGSDTTAGLEVTWVPGEMTRPTVYEIRTERETSIGSGSYTHMSTVIVNGELQLYSGHNRKGA